MSKKPEKMAYRQALITGASSGIGQAIALLLAKEQIPLFLTGRSEKRLALLAESLKGQVPVSYMACDLGVQEGRQALLEWISVNEPDLVIQSAGFGLYGPALSHSPKELLEMVEVNVSALLEIALATARALRRANKPGTLLHLSSLAASAVMPGFSVYCATKGAVLQLSESLDFEWEPYGIRVLTLCPGYVTTAFQERASLEGKIAGGISPYSLSVESTAKAALWQIRHKKRTLIIDWRSKVIAFFCHYLLPKAWVAAFSKKRFINTDLSIN